MALLSGIGKTEDRGQMTEDIEGIRLTRALLEKVRTELAPDYA